MSWTLTLEQAVEAGPGQAGGKGWNLGRMARYGLPVPDAFVVSADLYRALVAHAGVAEAIAALAGVRAADAANPDVATRLDAVRSGLAAAPWPAGAESDLAVALSGSGLVSARVAVRSSATAEDSGAHSFAGIHDSVLDVSGLASIKAAVITCFASLWSPRALGYRRHRGLADDAVACAVVVGRMVPATAAGVAFTCDPNDGRRDIVRISAVAGLGDALVSGKVQPHESAVHFCQSELRVVLHPAASPLTPGSLIVLARLALRVLWAFGDGQDPQDIEWVFDGERFVLVQARPVTSPGDPRPKGLAPFPTLWSNANIKDAVPVVLSTMGWSMVQGAIDAQLFLVASESGYPVPPGMATVRRFSGRGYFDITLMQWLMNDSFGISPHELTETMGGSQPELPLPPRTSLPLREQMGMGWRALKLLGVIRRMEGRIDAMQALHRSEVDALATAEPAGLSNQAITERLIALARSAFRFQQHFMVASTAAGAWLNMLRDALKAAVPAEDVMDLATALLAGSGEVPSAQAGYAIGAMAEKARSDAPARAYLEAAPRDPQGWRQLPPESPFRQEFERFRREHGHRTVYEADILNPRWNEDPTYILDQVRAALDRPAAAPEVARRVRRKGEEALARISWFRRPGIRWLARKAARGASYREGSKSMLSYSLGYSRALLLETGQRMVAAGVLERREDVFHLAVAELLSYLFGEWDGRGAKALVADRLAMRARWLAELPPDCFVANPDGSLTEIKPGGAVPAGLRPPAPPVEHPAGWIGGLALSSGTASGLARCIKHPEDGHRLVQGEVLVAPSTDPAWTPLFLRASAIVMETGGMLSHGAIVAREYGLPAVSNVPDLWARVREGQRVTVDGARGRISVSDA